MQTALITGAYKGLGLALARTLAKQGWQVVLTARNMDNAASAAEKLLEEGLEVTPAQADITKEKDLLILANLIENKFGKLDLLINNAGINPKDYPDKERMAKAFYLHQLDSAEMLKVLHTNSVAPLIAVKIMKTLLLKSANPRVMSISSWLGSVSNLSFGGHYAYVGSKNLLNCLNKSMAMELKNERIICVTVNPGWVQTDMGGSKATFTPDQAADQLISKIANNITIDQTGLFLNYDGTPHPW